MVAARRNPIVGICDTCNTTDVPLVPATGPTEWVTRGVALREVTWRCEACA
jgi:hypothetical protein